MAMKPILFSGPMVKAILEGRKTQTRRVIKPQPVCFDDECGPGGAYDFKGITTDCPYTDFPQHAKYQVGDTLWVRETWMPETEQGIHTGGYIYRATDRPEPDGDIPLRWRPSIFMPRDATRITLEVTKVRAEPVQDISKEDVIAEGLTEWDGGSIEGMVAGWHQPFATLWDSINEKRGFSWASNPWVWAYTFKIKEK